MDRIYLDNAATSWPKPEGVYQGVDHFLRTIGAPAGRGTYAAAHESATIVERARRGVARLIGAAQPTSIAFCSNGTDALNLAIHGWRMGCRDDRPHVVTTELEHNSVLRPLAALAARGEIDVSYLPVDCAGFVDPADVSRALDRPTALVVLNHASNVTGAVQQAAEIGRLAREHDALLLLDAAQTLGHEPIDVGAWHVDLLAAPGHKGLLGPLGTGILYVRPEIARRIVPTRLGGTGSHSESEQQPESMPDRFEAGNLNVAGLAGLAAGIEWVEQTGLEVLRERVGQRTARLLAGLGQLPGVRVDGPRAGASRVGVVSLRVEGYDPQELALTLEGCAGVEGRAGLHCAPRIHRALGTLDAGGTFRLSPGPFTTDDEIDATLTALASLVESGRGL